MPDSDRVHTEDLTAKRVSDSSDSESDSREASPNGGPDRHTDTHVLAEKVEPKHANLLREGPCKPPNVVSNIGLEVDSVSALNPAAADDRSCVHTPIDVEGPELKENNSDPRNHNHLSVQGQRQVSVRQCQMER